MANILVMLWIALMSFVLIVSGSRTSRRIENPVYWGQWSEWSPCSSTCGQGVTSRSRDCLAWSLSGQTQRTQSWRCSGRGMTKKLCYTKSCNDNRPAAQVDETCRELGKYGPSFYRNFWRRVKDSGKPCKIVCERKWSRKVTEAGNVKDNTPCTTDKSTTNGICKGGVCKEQITRSMCPESQQADMCLRCGGDNSSCFLLQGSREPLPGVPSEQGDEFVALIPEGSTFISIRKVTKGLNSLALVNPQNEYLLSTEQRLSHNSRVKAGGVTWTYEKPPGLELLTTSGPLQEDVLVLVLGEIDKHKTSYSFWAPLSKPTSSPDKPNRQNSLMLERSTSNPLIENAEDENFIWAFLDSQTTKSSLGPANLITAHNRQSSYVRGNSLGNNINNVKRGQNIFKNNQIGDNGPAQRPREHGKDTTNASDFDDGAVIFLTTGTSQAPTSNIPRTLQQRNNTKSKVSIPRKGSSVPNLSSSSKNTKFDFAPRYSLVVDKFKKNSSPARGQDIVIPAGVKGHTTPGRSSADNNYSKVDPISRVINSNVQPTPPYNRPTGGRRKKKGSAKKKKSGRPKTDTHVTAPLPNEFACYPCQRAKNRKKQFCAGDFVSKVYINRRRVVGDETRYDVTILSSYRNLVGLQQREFLWVASRCRCPYLRAKRTYILMGRMERHKQRQARLVLPPGAFVRGFSAGQDRRLRQLAKNRKCPN